MRTLQKLLHWAVFIAIVLNVIAFVFYGQLYLPEMP